MNVDARKMSHPSYRPFTTLGAIAAALDSLQCGDELVLEGVLDPKGNLVPINKVRASINIAKAKRVFKTSAINDYSLKIWRIA